MPRIISRKTALTAAAVGLVGLAAHTVGAQQVDTPHVGCVNDCFNTYKTTLDAQCKAVNIAALLTPTADALTCVHKCSDADGQHGAEDIYAFWSNVTTELQSDACNHASDNQVSSILSGLGAQGGATATASGGASATAVNNVAPTVSSSSSDSASGSASASSSQSSPAIFSASGIAASSAANKGVVASANATATNGTTLKNNAAATSGASNSTSASGALDVRVSHREILFTLGAASLVTMGAALVL